MLADPADFAFTHRERVIVRWAAGVLWFMSFLALVALASWSNGPDALI